jgi:subtilisin family serine protease
MKLEVEIVVLRSVTPQLPPDVRPDLGGKAKDVLRTFAVNQICADPRQIADIRQEKDVKAASMALPLKLYRPVSVHSSVTKDSYAWGIKAVGANQSFYSGLGATIAILDTGINIDHEAFARIRENVVQADFTKEGDGDTNGHGTHCAGIAFGDKVAGCHIGVAPGISRALIGKVFGCQVASTATLASAIDWAVKKGANIISMSLGINYLAFVHRLVEKGYPMDLALSMTLQAHQDTLDLFAAIAARTSLCGHPVVILSAAGNASRANENPQFVFGLEPPAAAKGIISVAALQSNGDGGYAVAHFSNGGARVAAPGVDVISADAASTSGIIAMSGTSMATPHVAGIAALWYECLSKSHSADLTTQLLTDRLIGSGSLANIPSERIRDVGTGLVQAPFN